MTLCVSVHCLDAAAAAARGELVQALGQAGVHIAPSSPQTSSIAYAKPALSSAISSGSIAPAASVVQHQARFALVVLSQADPSSMAQLQQLAAHARLLAIVCGERALPVCDMWTLLGAGATDVLRWPADIAQVAARLTRWHAVCTLADSALVSGSAAGVSEVWRALLHSVVEIAAFTDSPVLITGETGTGKDVIAQLISRLNAGGAALTVLDCTTLSPELAGSELFGHERGAFTGAAAARDGAFALADGGVLFLDEVGELPLPLQAQLLRAIQERSYKRIGSNSWQSSTFRLLCATNRDLEHEVERGRFRADLFYRIAAWRCRMPPLRERRDDVLPLAAHFLAQLAPGQVAPTLDQAVREYLLTRDYPGNVRELRQVVTRLWHRHIGPGPLTIGAVPFEDRAAASTCQPTWPDRTLEAAVRRAIDLGVPLARITQCAGDLAIQLVLAQEGDNNQRAAARLGVTDRALQIRRKAWSEQAR